MELAAAGISEQPFRTHGRPLTFVHYEGQLSAREFLHAIYAHPHGLGLLQGPPLSGKTSIIYHFVRTLPDDASAAVVNGARLDGKRLLARIVHAFGFDIELDSQNELLNVLRVYANQQAISHHAPLLVVENAHALTADGLQVLCELAGLRYRAQCALRIVLSSDRSMLQMIDAPAMTCIRDRMTAVFNLMPMDLEETVTYLHAKLRAAGCESPSAVLPDATCVALYHAAGGWPGIVDRLVLLALARARFCPLGDELVERPVVPPLTGPPGMHSSGWSEDREMPSLFLSYNGRLLRSIPLGQSRIMIGRSEHNDVPIASRFISRHHALFIRNGTMTLLMDLNSTNGTFVNSHRVSNHIMANNDVVTIGHHALKFVDSHASSDAALDGASFSDTVIMKSLDDMRRMLARENTQLLDFGDDAERMDRGPGNPD